MRSAFGSLLALIYLIVGVVVAHSHHYFAHVAGFRSFISAVLAVILWPLLLVGSTCISTEECLLR